MENLTSTIAHPDTTALVTHQVPGKGLYASYKHIFLEQAYQARHLEPADIWEGISGEVQDPSIRAFDYIAMIAWSHSVAIMDEYFRLKRLGGPSPALRAVEFGGYLDWTPTASDLEQMNRF